jgi:hypothetical protein
MPSETHIVPVLVGDPENCKAASDLLLTECGIYIQPINYPTVQRGMERLRITPSPYHDNGMIDALAKALIDVWERLDLPREDRAQNPPIAAVPARSPSCPWPTSLSGCPAPVLGGNGHLTSRMP